MNRIKVNSSNIHSISFEKNTLEIKFKSNQIYKFINVPIIIYLNFLFAKSKGSFFSHSIKGKFIYKRIA
jgi:hypothetical protein